ncbi:hypothetical protein L7F22_049034 [Adiantum nelumboides]|nr:hypothetical protein [Adiantum nelumboides]
MCQGVEISVIGESWSLLSSFPLRYIMMSYCYPIADLMLESFAKLKVLHSKTIEELQKEIESKLYHHTGRNAKAGSPSIRTAYDESRVKRMACDVSKVADVRALAEFAAAKFGFIDIWVNNAGVSKGFRTLVQFSDDDIRQIVEANLIVSLICTREVIRVMKLQPKGGHVFNMDEAGSGGSTSTPLTAVYGATKCRLRQLHTSLLQECKHS